MVSRNLRLCRKYLKNPHKVVDLLEDCRRVTDEPSKSESIREAKSDVRIRAHFPAFQSFTDFVHLLVENLRSLEEDVSVPVLYLLQNELGSIHRYLNSVQRQRRGCCHSVVSSFLVGFQSVILRIAVQSCNLLFNRTDPEATKVVATALVDLDKEIDPSNPKFLQLNLTFLGTDCSSIAYYRYWLLDPFCSYILLDVPGKEEVRKELISLVKVLSDTCKESICEEIEAVLREVAFSLREATSLDLTAALPLIKGCLLKAQLFLKKQVKFGSLWRRDIRRSREFTKDLRNICKQEDTEYLKQNLVLAQDIDNVIDSLEGSPDLDFKFVKHTFLQKNFKITFFEAESFLADLLKSSDTSSANEKDQIQSLVEDLHYFKRIVSVKLEMGFDDKFIREVEAIARGVTLLSYSFLSRSEKLEKMIHSLPRLLDEAKATREKVREMSQQFPRIIFPKTDVQGFIDILARQISQLLKHYFMSIAPAKEIEEALLHLESFKSNFLAKVKDGDAVLQGELKSHIIEVAYKLEYVVDSIELGGSVHQSLWLYDLLQDIRLIHQRVSKIHEMSYASKVKNPPQILSRDTTTEINEMMADLGDGETAIVGRLTRGSKQRDIVSIVGMPGSGKTTLARKVYNNQNVIHYFHRRAWCTVSQTYSMRELLLEILSHMPLLTVDISQLTEDDLLSKLSRCLLKNKYLIVMDDIWDTAAWNDLENYIPDDSNGSRILITSSRWDVASNIKPDRDPHSIRLFSNDESWMLLEKRIFKGAVCPGELKKTGMEIAQYCQGLPLAVAVIAGLLQRIERSKDSWEKVSRSLSSVIINNPENGCKDVLELSYKNLPEYLKPCFLYCGVFLEDKDIPVRKLMHFWMAEAFIQGTESKSLEAVAEDYLLELINRSLVTVHNKRSNGKAKTCRLHDLLRDLCHLKAKEENFLQLVSRHDEPYASFPDSDYGVKFDRKNKFAPTAFESYRLSFYLKRQHFIDSRPSGLGVRSLTFFASFDSEPKCPYDISFICKNFMLLRILDLEYIVMENRIPDGIELMVQLKYLAITGYMQYIPYTIANLWRLEALVVNGLRGNVVLPETIWRMKSLRHLRVNKHVAFESIPGVDKQVSSSFLLPNLVSLSTPSISYGEDTLNLFRRLPNLHKLRCIWDSSEDCNGFPILDFLTHLESLKIIYYGPVINSGEFVLPTSLKKLTLSNFCLQKNHLSMIGELPYLRILKLLDGAFEGQTWIMEEEDQFKELSFLELDSMNIVEWNASYDHLPRLERLVLRNCKALEVIPSNFAYITTLKTIEVQWCGQSVEVSAEEIQKETNEIQILTTRF